MRNRLPRPLRLGLPAVAVLALALTGCSDPATPSVPGPSAPEPTPSAPASSAPTTAPAPGRIDPGTGTTGDDGLTVRYLSDDDGVKILRVEDFPR